MSARANVVDNFMANRVDLYIGERYEDRTTQVFFGDGHGTYETFTEHSGATEPRPSLTLREDHARALLSALLRHYSGGDDARALRSDYDAERKRVDKLTDALIALVTPPASLIQPQRVSL